MICVAIWLLVAGAELFSGYDCKRWHRRVLPFVIAFFFSLCFVKTMKLH